MNTVKIDKNEMDKDLRLEKVVLVSRLNKQKYLLEDFMELVDMFATGNVDLRFYKRVRKDYLASLKAK